MKQRTNEKRKLRLNCLDENPIYKLNSNLPTIKSNHPNLFLHHEVWSGRQKPKSHTPKTKQRKTPQTEARQWLLSRKLAVSYFNARVHQHPTHWQVHCSCVASGNQVFIARFLHGCVIVHGKCALSSALHSCFFGPRNSSESLFLLGPYPLGLHFYKNQ